MPVSLATNWKASNNKVKGGDKGKEIHVKSSLTIAIRPVPIPMRGLAATMTSVNFQPFTKPMQKPHTKVVKRCKKMAT